MLKAHCGPTVSIYDPEYIFSKIEASLGFKPPMLAQGSEYHAAIQVHCVGLSLDFDSFLYCSPIACLSGSDIGFFPVDVMVLVHHMH